VGLALSGQGNLIAFGGLSGEAGGELLVLCDTAQMCFYGFSTIPAGVGMGWDISISANPSFIWGHGVHKPSDYRGWFGTLVPFPET